MGLYEGTEKILVVSDYSCDVALGRVDRVDTGIGHRTVRVHVVLREALFWMVQTGTNKTEALQLAGLNGRLVEAMKKDCAEIAARGKTIRVNSAQIDGRTIIVNGGLIKTATVFDEEFVEGNVIHDPRGFLSKLLESGLQADIFTFAEKIYEAEQKHPYPFEWDNAAVACTTSFKDWWEKLPQESRKNVRRAAKRGVIVQLASFDEKFIQGIKEIYDEMPVRQGRRFWHFGKDLETVKSENGTYLDRSEFIGAYHNGALIGFMKFVRVGRIATMMQILSKAAHYDKRPMNAMIAKAVEVCQEKGLSYLVYSKFTYGNKMQSQIADFKRRNGFVQMNFPRYFIPLTLKGKLVLRLKLHRGLLGILPSWLIGWLWRLRSAVLMLTHRASSVRRTAECDPEAR